jgi:hypothetical protein
MRPTIWNMLPPAALPQTDAAMPRLTRALIALALAGASLPAIAPAALAQDWRLPPVTGAYEVTAGFLPDPLTVEVTAGGEVNSEANLPGTCNGFVTERPTVRVVYQPGEFQLAFYATSGVDITMIVNAPDGRWYCRDDFQRLNPAVVFPNPEAGQYDIWIGTFARGNAGAVATLAITEGEPFSR